MADRLKIIMVEAMAWIVIGGIVFEGLSGTIKATRTLWTVARGAGGGSKA